MNKLIIVLVLMFAGGATDAAYAGKFAGQGRVQRPPTMVLGTSSECGIAPHQPGPWPRCQPFPNANPTPMHPHGGCGYYGPNGVLIRCP